MIFIQNPKMANRFGLPDLGLGLGLRHVHFEYILKHKPKVDWFEIISENFMYSHGKPRHILRTLAEQYPIVMHGVSLSIGSTDKLDMDYLHKLRTLADEVQPKWISDHLCWTGLAGINTHDLLPVPLNEQSLNHIRPRIEKVQDFLGRPLILENPSTYLQFQQSDIPEHEFLSALVKSAGCGLLLDVNNTYVSCFNSGADPVHYIDNLPADAIVQIHIAGHQHRGTHIIDTHDREISSAVWTLYQQAWNRTGGVSTLLEWDGNIPDFETCLAELYKAKLYMAEEEHFEPETADTGKDELSTPIDFLVAPVMNESLE